MTKQEIFNTVWNYFIINKNEKSATGGGGCYYRIFPSNVLEGEPVEPIRRCAVGCLIPDDMYQDGMEGRRVNNLFPSYPQVAELIGLENMDFCSNLQACHDDPPPRGVEFHPSLELRLRQLAIEYNLLIPA